MFKSISELDAHFRYTNVSVIFSVFSLCNCLSIYSKSLRVLTIFRCLIFKVLFRSFFPFLSAFFASQRFAVFVSSRAEQLLLYSITPLLSTLFFDFFSFLFFALYIVVYQCYKHKIFPPLTAFRHFLSKKSFPSSKKILKFFKKYFLFFEKILFLFHYRMFFNPLKSHLTSFTIFNYTLNIHI